MPHRDMNDTWLIVGLGNPGPQYEASRHNAGRMTVIESARRAGVRFTTHKAGALVAEARMGSARCVLAAPNSFMNLSGGPVARLLRFWSLEPDRLVVVHDDLDLPFGTLRLKVGGGHGGHNGVRDIITALGTPAFTRVRLGIGRPPAGRSVIDFVLQRFTATERRGLDLLISDAADAVEMIATDGLAAAQQRFHTARQQSTP